MSALVVGLLLASAKGAFDTRNTELTQIWSNVSRNTTVIAALFACSLSVAGAILPILELDRPFGGLIPVSSAPARDALGSIDQSAAKGNDP